MEAEHKPKNPLNPGTIEELHKQCQSVFPMYFEGAKLIVNKGLSQTFQVSHNLSLSNAQPAGYRFGATYVGEKILGPGEAYPLLMGDMDPSGNLNANVVHAPTDNTRVKMMAQIQDGAWQGAQISADYKERLYTASLTLGNPDLIHGTGVAVLHYLRAVTQRLSLGAELAYQASPQLPGGHIGVLSMAGRYATEDSSLSATLGMHGQLHASFWQKCSDSLQMGVEAETNFKAGESQAMLAYEASLAKGEFVLKGSVDTNMTVKSVIEKKLTPLPFTLALCSLINHRKGAYQFGCGLIIG